MRYLSVCSGIEAASVAWHQLGWTPVGFSEIEKFPNSVLAHHYPDVPNFGDLERYSEWTPSDFDVLVGGTPCQSFSIAGLRKGMADPRGNLTLAFVGVVARFSPRWVLWENVPGAFSSVSHHAPDPSLPGTDVGLERGRGSAITHDEYDAIETHAFACFLAGLSELGYGWAYRILDAQYFGVPQRRRRVFVVGHSSGDWQRAAAVLLERHSLFRHPAPSRETRSDLARALGASVGGCSAKEQQQTFIPEIVPQAMSAKWHKGSSGPAGDEHHNLISEPVTGRPYADRGSDANVIAEAFKPSHYTRDKDGAPSETHPPLSADADKGDQDPLIFESRYARNDRGAPSKVCPPLKAESGQTGRGDGAPLVYQCHGDNVGPMGTLRSGHNEISGVPFTFDETQITHPENRSNPQPGDPVPTIPTHGRPPTVAYSIFPDAGQGSDLNAVETDTGHTLGVSTNERGTRIVDTRVRRLTPLECERLQGFPDGWTDIPGASDSARYRALGNSMAVPVMRWIGQRLQRVEEIK